MLSEQLHHCKQSVNFTSSSENFKCPNLGFSPFTGEWDTLKGTTARPPVPKGLVEEGQMQYRQYTDRKIMK